MNDLVTWVEARIKKSTRADRIVLSRLLRREPQRQLVLITRGIYLDASDLPADTEPWTVKRIVTIARAFALATSMSAGVPLMFTGECAGQIVGVGTRSQTPDILFRAATSRKRKRQLPAVTINGRQVAAVSAVHVTGGLLTRLNECDQHSGLFVVPAAVMIADSARREHNEQAFTLACMLLTRHTSYNRFAPAAALEKAKKLRREWLKKANIVRGQRAYRILVTILHRMRTGIDSPLEAAVLWALECLLPPTLLEELVNQEEVITPGGELYYLDFAFPDKKLAFEADGRIKYSGGRDRFEDYAGKHINRHQDLVDSGWTIRRLTFADVSGADSFMRIHVHLQKLGLRPRGSTPKPSGYLYQHRTGAYLQKLRR